jgi:hypothetical protein
MNGRSEKYVQNFGRKPEGNHSEDLDVDGEITFEFMLRK